MTKAGDKVLEGAREALAFARGDESAATVHVPPKVDIKAIRKSMNLSQQAFAARFGFSAGAVRNWEQGIRTPETAARAYLIVIQKEPEAVQRALSE
jgi:putative transcriptional regulator